jgi:hypothetical protein
MEFNDRVDEITYERMKVLLEQSVTHAIFSRSAGRGREIETALISVAPSFNHKRADDITKNEVMKVPTTVKRTHVRANCWTTSPSGADYRLGLYGGKAWKA